MYSHGVLKTNNKPTEAFSRKQSIVIRKPNKTGQNKQNYKVDDTKDKREEDEPFENIQFVYPNLVRKIRKICCCHLVDRILLYLCPKGKYFSFLPPTVC